MFDPGLGTLKGFQAKISIDPEAKPRFCKARTVPYALREKVELELQRLVDEGTLEPVEYSDWASPIVAVLKPDKKSVRICGDFKQTVNPVSQLDRYPIPKVEDLFAQLSGGKTFTKLDLSQAYQQVSLDEESKKYVVINTQKGLFLALWDIVSSCDISESYGEPPEGHLWSGRVLGRHFGDGCYL